MYDANVLSMESASEGNCASPCTNAVSHGGTVVGLAELAKLLGVTLPAPAGITDIEFAVKRLHPGETLCRAGDDFEALYVVRSGFLKTVCVDGSGNEQVLAFPMRGDAIGVDGFDRGQYASDAVALESCHVIVVPFRRIAALAERVPGVERFIYSIFNHELVHRQNMVRLLGMMNAEARVAAFLLDLSERFGGLGCSKSSFILRMSRQDLGSYLGIKLETVSRALSAFAALRLIDVSRRELVLNDVQALRRKLDAPAAKECSQRPRHQSRATSRLASPRIAPQSMALSMAA
jgi:CRP/FNR family transcriptional regulator, anaerobic regulatory protein